MGGCSHGWRRQHSPPDNSPPASLRHYSVLHQLPTAEMRPATVLLLLFQHGLDSGFCLILNRIRVPGLVWSGRYLSIWLRRIVRWDFLVGMPPCTVTLTLKVKSSTLWNGTRWVYFGNVYLRTWNEQSQVWSVITYIYCKRVVKRCFAGCPPSRRSPSQSIPGPAFVLTRCPDSCICIRICKFICVCICICIAQYLYLYFCLPAALHLAFQVSQFSSNSLGVKQLVNWKLQFLVASKYQQLVQVFSINTPKTTNLVFQSKKEKNGWGGLSWVNC